MKLLSIIYLASYFWGSFSISNSVLEPCGCGTKESYTFADTPDYETGDWIKSWGPLDGTYFQINIAFDDGYSGVLFKGAISDDLFIEDSNGKNYYYVSERAALRALYLYKRFGCITDKYKLSK